MKARTILLGLVVVALAIAAAVAGKNHAAHRAWLARLPPLPAPAGAAAPGLDGRLAAVAQKMRTWPPDAAALAEFTRLCHANGDLAEAVTGYQALMMLQPREPRWPHLLASILATFGRQDDALPLLQRTVELAPDHVVAWLRLGDARLKSNDAARAQAAYEQALRLDGDNPYALLGLARCDLQLERWTAARRHLEQAVAHHQDFYGAQSLLATVFERLGNSAAAAAAAERTPANGHYADPPDDWTDELVPYCHNTYTLLVTGSAADADGRPQKAIATLERALALAPDNAQIHRQLAKTRSRLGDLPAARKELERAVEIDPASETMELDYIALLHVMKDQPALERAVARAVAACPNDAGLHYEAGLLASSAGRLDEAAAHLAFAARNRPDQPAAALELASVNFRAGQVEQGIGVLDKLITANPQFAPAHAALVREGIATGDPRARAWLQRAMAAGLPPELLAELQENYEHRFGSRP